MKVSVSVKMLLRLIKHHSKEHGGTKSEPNALLTSALDGSGRLHAPAVLLWSKSPRYSLNMILGRPLRQSGGCEENVLPPSEIRT
jgi:hypothetical protein